MQAITLSSTISNFPRPARGAESPAQKRSTPMTASRNPATNRQGLGNDSGSSALLTAGLPTPRVHYRRFNDPLPRRPAVVRWYLWRGQQFHVQSAKIPVHFLAQTESQVPSSSAYGWKRFAWSHGMRRRNSTAGSFALAILNSCWPRPYLVPTAGDISWASQPWDHERIDRHEPSKLQSGAKREGP